MSWLGTRGTTEQSWLDIQRNKRFYLLQNVQTGCGANPSSSLADTENFYGRNEQGVTLTSKFHLVSRLRIRGAIPSLAHTCLWRGIFARGELYVWRYLLLGCHSVWFGRYVRTYVPEELTTATVTLMIEAVSSYETSPFCYQTSCHISEDILVTAGPSNFFAFVPWAVSIKCGIMGYTSEELYFRSYYITNRCI